MTSVLVMFVSSCRNRTPGLKGKVRTIGGYVYAAPKSNLQLTSRKGSNKSRNQYVEIPQNEHQNYKSLNLMVNNSKDKAHFSGSKVLKNPVLTMNANRNSYKKEPSAYLKK